MLLYMDPEIVSCLQLTFQANWQNGHLPTHWREDNKICIPKPGKPSYDTPKAYRTLSLGNRDDKLYQRVHTNRLYHFMEDTGCFDAYQYAYRKDRSIVMALLLFSLEVLKAKRDGKFCIAAFVDLEGAFDAIWRYGLLYKLWHAGIRGRMFNYIKQYLTNRRTRLIVNGRLSEWIETLIGLPQGSILAPILFIFFIAEMTSTIPRHMSYADDLDNWAIANTKQECVEQVHSDMIALLQWCRKWRMIINASKTEFIAFGQQHEDVTIEVNGALLPQVQYKKVLGVILEENMSFNRHVEDVVARGHRALAALAPIMSDNGGAPAELGSFLYRTCVRPILENSFTVWCTIGRPAYVKLEGVQRAALAAATGVGRTVALSTLEVMTNTPPLRLRLDEVLVGDITRILSKNDEDPIRQALIQHHEERFCDGSRTYFDTITVVEPILNELGCPFNQLANDVERSTIIRDFALSSLPKVIKIDDGTWGSSNNRSEEQQEKSKSDTIKFLEELPNTVIPIFTDGSALGNPGPCGASAIIYSDGLANDPVKLNFPISSWSTSYHGELAAICEAAKYVYELCSTRDSVHLPSAVHVFSDCQSAIASLSSHKILSAHHQLKTSFLDNHSKLLELGIPIRLTWVAGHVDLEANELADAEAKNAAEEAEFTMPPTFTRNSIRARCRQRTLKLWQSSWRYGETGRRYQEVRPKVSLATMRSHLPSYLEKPLLRLQAGATNLRGETLWKAELHEDYLPNCECGEIEDVEHVLFQCRLLTKERLILETAVKSAYDEHEVPRIHRTLDVCTLLGGSRDDIGDNAFSAIELALAEFIKSSKRSF